MLRGRASPLTAGEGPGGRRAEAARRGLGGNRLLLVPTQRSRPKWRETHFILFLNFAYLFIFLLWLGLPALGEIIELTFAVAPALRM